MSNRQRRWQKKNRKLVARERSRLAVVKQMRRTIPAYARFNLGTATWYREINIKNEWYDLDEAKDEARRRYHTIHLFGGAPLDVYVRDGNGRVVFQYPCVSKDLYAFDWRKEGF